MNFCQKNEKFDKLHDIYGQIEAFVLKSEIFLV